MDVDSLFVIIIYFIYDDYIHKDAKRDNVHINWDFKLIRVRT